MFATATSIDSRLTVGPAGSESTPAAMCPPVSPAVCQPVTSHRRHNLLRRLLPRFVSLMGRPHSLSTQSRTCLLQTTTLVTVLVIACSVQLAAARPHPSSHHSSGGSGASSSSTKNLGVYITRSPESTTAPAGDEVLFECELNLIPERLEWRFRPQDSPGNRDDYVYLSREHGHNVTTVESNSKLHVYVNAKTIGEYRCVAWFGASAIASVPATLTLATLSPVAGNSINNNSNGYGGNYGRGGSSSNLGDVHSGRTDRVPIMMRRVLSPIQQQHVKISPGNSIIIKCGDVVSNPPAIYSYYKDEITIPANIPQLPTGGLILSQLIPQDSGTYRCSAVNSITGTELKLPLKTTIQVEYTPRSAPFTFSNPSNVSVTPGSSALLECPGVANPVPQATWYRRDGAPISSNSQQHPYGLQINNVIPEDQGEYACRVTNGIEPALVHTVKLTVLEPPRIIVPPRPTLTNESERLELECIARGSPNPEIYWMINGDYTKWDQLIKANGSKLIINSVQKKHAGIVQCFARNELGEVSESDLLQVKPKQIPGGMGAPPLLPPLPKPHEGTGSKRPKGTKNRKHKHLVMIPPSRPNITRLSDESVMVRWSVPSSDGLPIQFFKVQYRMLGDPTRNITRTQWMTENEDIPPYTRSYEVNGLKSDHFYRFRIVAVYSNNDNKEGAASGKFHLQRLGPKNHLLAPTLTRIEPVSQHAILLHWQFPHHLPHPIDGFYAYYRAATTAGEYSKATVDTPTVRHFKIDHLEPGTAYEFKLQSFTAAAASDFSAILTGKTLKPPTPPPVVPSVVAASEAENGTGEVPNYVYMGVGGFVLIVAGIILLCCCCVACKKKRGGSDETDAKSQHIQVEANGFPGGLSNGGPRSHHHKARNGISARMNITPNPLAQDGDKNRNVMELRFLPPKTTMPGSTSSGGTGIDSAGVSDGGGSATSAGGGGTILTNNNNQAEPCSYPSINHHNPHHPHPAPGQHQQQQQQNHVQHPSQTVGVPLATVVGQEHLMLASMPHRRTLERSMRNLHHNGGGGGGGLDAQQKMMLDGDCGVTTTVGAGVGIVLGTTAATAASARNNSSIRRGRRGSGSVPGSPRVGRGPSAELLQHNRSPMPIRAAASGVKRAARLGRAENMSSGSLNSIEV